MKSWISKFRRDRDRRIRLKRDGRIIGSMEWAEYLCGWYDDVTDFEATPDGGLRLKKLEVALPKEQASILLGRNKNYGYCLDLKKAGVSFEPSSNGVILRHGRLVFCIGSSVELFILWELLCRHSYRYVLPPGQQVIFDIGMNVGLASLVLADRNPQALVCGFEPFPSTFSRLEKNLALNPDVARSITAYPYALADRDARETWKLGVENCGSSSQFADALSGRVADVPIEVRKASAIMSDFLSRHPPADYCVVKMDCEGGEYAIMRDWASSGFANRIDLILMEYHEVAGHNATELQAWFQDNGFSAVVLPAPPEVGLHIGMIYAYRLPFRLRHAPQAHSGN